MGYVVARKTGQRIRSGIQTSAAVTSAYAVESFPLAADQYDVILWTIASEGSQPPQPARVSTNADGSKSDDGYFTLAWRFSFLTFAMMSYFLTQTGLTSARTADVTVMTYNELDVATYLTCKITRPLMPGADCQYAVGGWQNVVFRFSLGQII